MLILLFIAGLFSCNGCKEKKEITDADIERMRGDMVSDARKKHEREMKDIEKFIQKKEWPMTETGTGLHYWIYDTKNGISVKNEDIVSISYTITLLDDTFCYGTPDSQPKEVRIGRDNVETGLHEALLLMKVGDRAKLVLPSHLAFGFSGDSGKIPPDASVVYDIHLLSVR